MPAVAEGRTASMRGVSAQSGDGKANVQPAAATIGVLIVVPTLDGGAPDVGALGLVRILTASGHRTIVVARAAADVVVSAAVQPEGLQRAILEAQAMARPVITSELGAGPDVVLTPPAVPESRITGLRFHSGDDAALAAALLRLFSMPQPTRRAMGMRGRDWVLNHFDADMIAEQTLALYEGLLGEQRAVVIKLGVSAESDAVFHAIRSASPAERR
jgi:glycosyltransferase involved in cell wall biosynthesis